jgi:hypothetical protein
VVSKAIASLDAWLARAEELLEKQRAHGISPSLVSLPDNDQEYTIITLETLRLGLKELLDSLCSRPGRWILIVEDNQRRNLFWQALAYEDGSLVTETVSNYYLDPEHQWTPGQEEQLSKLGWLRPDPPVQTNWLNVERTTAPITDVIVCRALATLRFVFGLSMKEELGVKLFSSAIRGDTPAGAQYSSEDEAASLPSAGGAECDYVSYKKCPTRRPPRLADDRGVVLPSLSRLEGQTE